MNTHSETFTALVCKRYRICLAQSHASHTIISVSSRYEFFRERPAAEFLCKLCSAVGSDLGVGAIDLMKYTWVSPISEV